MLISKKNFPKIMLDNDSVYLQHLIGVIDSVDELSSMEVTRGVNSYKFRIAPSLPKYIPTLLEEILKFHNLYGIRLDLSKSIKTSATINFEINNLFT